MKVLSKKAIQKSMKKNWREMELMLTKNGTSSIT
jgi:hypothetical protein